LNQDVAEVNVGYKLVTVDVSLVIVIPVIPVFAFVKAELAYEPAVTALLSAVAALVVAVFA
jgi:hypothetical protein